MNILFVTVNGIEDSTFGGAQASKRNYNCLTEFGNVLVYHIKKKSNKQSLKSVINGCFPPIKICDGKEIEKLIINEKIDLVFFDGSFYGNIIKKIKSLNVSKVVFYHNCEQDYISVRFGKAKSLKKYIYFKLIKKEESFITRYADYKIVFTERDKKRIENLYNTKVDAVIPIGIADSYKEQEIFNQGRKYCLLFGPAGTANIEAFDWFRIYISPFLNCKTFIAGNGFERYVDEWSNEKVEVVGYVKDISVLYQDAICVAIPLLSGGGMKIKTAEALMHGKFVFGTKEALIGYEKSINSSFVRLCNSKDEFINSINSFLATKQSFNYMARDTYLQFFSINVAAKHFEKMMETLKV